MTDINFAAFDRQDILDVVFHPRRDLTPPCPEELMIKGANGVNLSARLYASETHAPLILFFHGNGEIASDYDMIAPLYRRLGLTLLVVDYRAYGRSEGSPAVSDMMLDAIAVAQHLPKIAEKHNLAPEKIFVMGRSLGSASALCIATTCPENFNGIIIESGFAYELKLIARLGGPDLSSDPDFAAGFGTLDKVAHLTLPLLIIHGSNDYIIPYSDAKALHENAGTDDKTLVRINAAGHNDLLMTGMQVYFDAVKKFVEAH